LQTWAVIGTNVPAGDGVVSYIDGACTNYPSRFYRIVMP